MCNRKHQLQKPFIAVNTPKKYNLHTLNMLIDRKKKHQCFAYIILLQIQEILLSQLLLSHLQASKFRHGAVDSFHSNADSIPWMISDGIVFTFLKEQEVFLVFPQRERARSWVLLSKMVWLKSAMRLYLQLGCSFRLWTII